MAWELDICGDEAVQMPMSDTCDECAAFAQRLAVVEALLDGFTRRSISMVDSAGKSTTATVAGTVTISGV